MGCWNETCGLSHLPIKYKEDVRFVILFEVNGHKRKEGIYYNDEYAPLCLPMSGKYNDYGSIENVDIELSITLELLKNLKLFIKNDGYVPYEFEDIEKFLDDIGGEEIYFYCGHTYYRLRIIMYHKSLFDLLVNSFSSRVPYNHQKKDTIKLLWKDRINRHYEKFLNLKDEIKDCTDKNEIEKYESMLLFRALQEPVFSSSQYSYNFVREYEKYISNENFDKYSDLLIDYIMFTESLAVGRQGFFSLSGSGSQDTEMYVQKLIAEWSLSFIENARKDEDWDILEDDDDIKETVFWYDRG